MQVMSGGPYNHDIASSLLLKVNLMAEFPISLVPQNHKSIIFGSVLSNSIEAPRRREKTQLISVEGIIGTRRALFTEFTKSHIGLESTLEMGFPEIVTKLSCKHALLIASPGWGHLRPLISLAARLVHERPDVIISYTIPGGFESRVKNEMDRYFHSDETALKENIRTLQLGRADETDLVQVYESYFQGFAKVYPAIYGEEPVLCASGRVYSANSRPDVILLDPFLLDMLQTVRRVSGRVIPVLTWNTASLAAMLRFYGPSSLGGLSNVPLKAQAIVKETGKPIDEVYNELYQPETGEVIELPGMPSMYDYEYNDQHLDALILTFQFKLYAMTFQFFEDCDGIVALGNLPFEPEVCAAYRIWFAPRPAYFVGPLLPDELSVGDRLSNSQEKELTGSSNGAEVKNFLDTIQKTHGDYSLLYISFGSHFWPTTGDIVWEIVEIVLDMKIPLILSHDPKRIEMPAELQTQLQASEIALVSVWAPQHFILGHLATGWFLTHCGNNSITEAISHGVPMIAWPLCADEPVNAAYMSSTLNIAYELFETRIGVGLKPLCRGVRPEGTVQAIEKEVRAVLTKAWGSDGAQKRENVKALSKKFNMAWGEDGEARKEFRNFLNKYLPMN